MVSLFVLSSCTKQADGDLNNEEKDKSLEATSIDENDLTESDEDLTTVDYKEFYDQLSSHGEWLQVQPEEIGLQSKTASSNSSSHNSFSLSNLLGIKDAFGSSKLNSEMVYVWKPSTDLAVTGVVVNEAPVYVPYTNGQWVNTDAGWYFKAPTPVEETVSHYGRWVNSPTAGWLWVPGRVWAPAWVDWKQNDNYVSWAPLPPSDYIVGGTMSAPVIEDNNYVIVEKKYFLEPAVYKYNNLYSNDGSRILVSDMSGTEGIVVVNNAIINRGPDVNVIQTIYGRNIELVKIKHVKNFNDVRYSESEYNVYAPGFKRYKNKGNTKFTVNEPKSFKKYDNFRKENNGNNKGMMDNDNNKGNMNNGIKGNMNNGNNKGKMNNGNNKGNMNNGNNKGNMNKVIIKVR